MNSNDIMLDILSLWKARLLLWRQCVFYSGNPSGNIRESGVILLLMTPARYASKSREPVSDRILIVDFYSLHRFIIDGI